MRFVMCALPVLSAAFLAGQTVPLISPNASPKPAFRMPDSMADAIRRQTGKLLLQSGRPGPVTIFTTIPAKSNVCSVPLIEALPPSPVPEKHPVFVPETPERMPLAPLPAPPCER